MSVNSNHENDRSADPAENVQAPRAAEAEVEGYLALWNAPIFAAEPPPGTTDPYGPPMPGRDMPAHIRFIKPLE